MNFIEKGKHFKSDFNCECQYVCSKSFDFMYGSEDFPLRDLYFAHTKLRNWIKTDRNENGNFLLTKKLEKLKHENVITI